MTATIEDEVRTMLARRAADIVDDAPQLPTGLRIAVDDRIPGPPERARVLALAAAIVLVLGAAGLVLATRDTDGEQTDATDLATTAPARPEHLAQLPLGVDPTVGPVRGLGQPAETPEEAADLFLAGTFGEDVMPGDPFTWTGADTDEVWAAHQTPLVGFDPAAWPGTEDDRTTGPVGTVTARRTDDGWSVVAVTSSALDLRDIDYDGTRLTGEVRSPSSAPLRVVVSTADGEELAKSDLTTFSAEDPAGARPSAFSLDDVEMRTDGQPVILRVEVGDRPGQVAIDGVRVAALATVVLPPSPPEGGRTSTTTEPDPTTAEAAGVSDLWRLPVAEVGDDPGVVATTYLEDLLSVPTDGTGVARLSADGPVSVDVDLPSGESVTVELERRGDEWSVLQVGDGAVERMADDAGRLSVQWSGLPTAADGSIVDVRFVLTHPTGELGAVDGEPEPSLVRAAAGAVAIATDAEGQVIGVTGNLL